MADLSERTLGYGFGLLGGLLIVLGAIVALVVGTMDLLVGRPFGAISQASEAIVLFVVGGLALLFAYLGRRVWKERALTAGILLIVTAAIGWAVLGFGANLLALLGGIFVFLGGVLYLVEPTKHVVTQITTPAA